MMPLPLNFLHKIYRIPHQLREVSFRVARPDNLVRLCKRRNEFQNIVNEALSSSDRNWEDELICRVIKHILDDEESEVSVYKIDTLDPLDYGHALAVIAEGIAQEDFRSKRGKKRKLGCTRGSLLIPTACLPKTATYKLTPNNNLNFYPANIYHFDLTIRDRREFAVALLNGINQKTISWSLLGNENPKGSYQLQAAIAYSYCLRTFGKIDSSNPPSTWRDGKTIDASEQIDTLKHLAQVSMLDSPTLSN